MTCSSSFLTLGATRVIYLIIYLARDAASFAVANGRARGRIGLSDFFFFPPRRNPKHEPSSREVADVPKSSMKSRARARTYRKGERLSIGARGRGRSSSFQRAGGNRRDRRKKFAEVVECKNSDRTQRTGCSVVACVRARPTLVFHPTVRDNAMQWKSSATPCHGLEYIRSIGSDGSHYLDMLAVLRATLSVPGLPCPSRPLLLASPCRCNTTALSPVPSPITDR